MLIIRLARHGRKKVPFYHLVVAEKSQAVKKRFIAQLGHYNPLHEGGKGELVFDEPEVKKYLKNGAQMSQTAARLLSNAGLKEAGKFVEARATKPKKETPPPEPKEEVTPPQAEESDTKTEEASASEEASQEESANEEDKNEEKA